MKNCAVHCWRGLHPLPTIVPMVEHLRPSGRRSGRLRGQARTCLLALLLAACGSAAEEDDTGRRSLDMTLQQAETSAFLEESLREDLRLVGRTRVFFGHQSVGANILEGLTTLAGEADVRVNIQRFETAHATAGITFVEKDLGQNGDALGKVDDFVASIRDMSDHPPTIALMKFCYLDIVASTDVDQVFEHYRSAMEKLNAEFPGITIVHVTVPLTTRWPVRLKEVAYRILHPEERGTGSAIRRQEFNDRLRETFAADPIFDLARAESTRPDGSRVTFRARGRSYEALEPKYTWDGAHLGEMGKPLMAQVLVRSLAATIRSRTETP